MELDSLVRHFFGSEDPGSLTAEEFDRALARLKIGFGVEREPSRRFALWTLLHVFDAAPLPAEAFAKEPQLKDAADAYLQTAFRIERRGEDNDG